MTEKACAAHRIGDGAAAGSLTSDTPVTFTVDGETYTGLAGDTLASALLANGRIRVGDSIYRRRPRGILSAGVEEPNAFVLVEGEHNESMLPATTVEAVEGLSARLLEGIGTLDARKDTEEYDKHTVHVEVAVVGSGPAGLAAAKAAAASGKRVVLLEQDHAFGGTLLDVLADDETSRIDEVPAADWAAQTVAELEAAKNVRLLKRTTVLGSYDNNYLVAVEDREGGYRAAGQERPDGVSRQRLWHIIAKEVVLATGAFDRPLVFANNDLPGVMFASAVQRYLGRYGVLAGKNMVFFTTHDGPYCTAIAAARAGAEVTLIDSRADSAQTAAAEAAGVRVRHNSVVVDAEGEDCVRAVWVATRGAEDQAEQLDADLLVVSGGLSPNVNLHSQRQGRMHWDEQLAGFVPTAAVEHQHTVGALNGSYSLARALAEGTAAGTAAAAGQSSDFYDPETVSARVAETGQADQLWFVPGRQAHQSLGHEATQLEALADYFVDYQRDNTVRDVLRATGAGMLSVEHVKRYTSISTGVEQGKIGGVATIGLIAQAITGGEVNSVATGQPSQQPANTAATAATAETGQAQPRPVSPGQIGTTTFRAPFTPVAFAALAGRAVGELYDAARETNIHPWHVEHGALFEDVGQWKRPWYYPQDGEDMEAAVARECRAARESVAFMDATTLGKIDIKGTDAAEFLNRVYTNGFLKLPVGKARYGIMCTPDGMVFDDGVTTRLAEDHFFMTTTTSGAADVLEWLEEWSQTEWPELDVVFTSATEQYTTIAVVGPKSRDVIAKVAPDLDVSKEGFGFMEYRNTTLASGIDARIVRITFSGELAYEINVPTYYGLKVWEDVAEAGAEFNITPYGTETMHVLRAEKAYPIVGQDTDGTVTPQDLGMDWIVSKIKKDFIGKRSYSRLANTAADRKKLVSVLPVDTALKLPEGTQLVRAEDLGDYTGENLPDRPIPMQGFVTSSYHSQALGRSFGLALIKNGPDLIGQKLMASFEGQLAEVEVGPTVLFDPEGERRDG
ncbi:2Fe-2S iron-sulfur cluster-binding protein [Micrococcoides hystricis]|uniref:2Fe-2S iron-sulfur cluster-binding protein n=1 Tax=Micrococcoides hystricis TaxID=1572761 RepID=A0ABV6P9Y3_9MICC